MLKCYAISSMKHSMTYKGTKCYTALYQHRKGSGYSIKVKIGNDALPQPLQPLGSASVGFESKDAALCAAKKYVCDALDT